MSDNENSAPRDESDEDIYKDISDFNFENVLAKLEGNNEAHRQEASDLSEKVKQLTEKNEELRKLNDTLGKNLSTLLKTAQNEIKRKESVIEELRIQVDSFIFRKNNKKTKDKSTSTEDLKNIFNVKNVNKECKSERDNCTNTFKTFDEKTGSFNENKYKKKTQVYDNIKDENISCDSGKNSNYKNSVSRVWEKDWDYRDGMRNSTKYDYFDKERFFPRSRDNHKWPRSRSYRTGRDHHRKRSPRRKRYSQRSRNISRSRSRSQSRSRSWSPQQSKSSKESSFERQRISKSPYNKNQKTKSRSSSSNKISDSECYKNFSKNNEEKDQSEKSKVKGVKISEKNGHIKEKAASDKNEKKNNFDFQDRKSPLDAFYDEMIAEVDSNLISTTENSKSKLSFEDKIQETEKQQNHSKSEVQKEDWTLSFKNERQNNTNPMTVYSWRMLQKLKLDSGTGAGNIEKNFKNCEETKTFQKAKSKEEKFQSNFEAMQTEKEPGELTEDENEVESSKEFQTLTKIASVENSFFEKSVLQNQDLPLSKDKGNLCKTEIDMFRDKKRGELTSVKINEKNKEIPKDKILDLQKDVDSPKEVRGLIEFSPFKNNYKLIEISPFKPVEASKSKRLPSNNYAQNTVESSTFKLLSALSGIPLYKESKPKTEQSHQESLNKMPNLSDLTSKENASIIKNINEVNISDEESIAIANSSKPKMCKNRKEPKMQENKMSKSSPGKQIEKGNREESIKPETIKDSNSEKTKSQNTETDDQSFPLIQSSMLSESFPQTDNKDPNFEKRHDVDHIIEKRNSKDLNSYTNIGKFLEIEPSKFSSFEKENNIASKVKVSSSKDKKITSPKLKEDSADVKTIHCDEFPENCKNDLTEGKKKRGNVLKSLKNETVKVESNSKTIRSKENNQEKAKRKSTLKNEYKKEAKEEKNCRKKRKLNEEQKTEETKESEDEPMIKRLRSHKDVKSEGNSIEKENVKEDISFFEFFKPIEKSGKANKTETEELSNSTDFKMTTTMSVTNVLCLETPNKGIEKFKNFMINEQTIYQVLDTKSNFSPRVGSNCIEMTPRRLLKNDLMLTDSEDDSAVKINPKCTPKEETKEKKENENDGDGDENDEMSESDNCEWESDSGASDFVDLL